MAKSSNVFSLNTKNMLPEKSLVFDQEKHWLLVQLLPNLSQQSPQRLRLFLFGLSSTNRSSTNHCRAPMAVSWLIFSATFLKQGHLTAEKFASAFVLISFVLAGRLYLQTGSHRRVGLRGIRGFGLCCQDLHKVSLAYWCSGTSRVGRKVGLWVAGGGFEVSQWTWLNCLLGEREENESGRGLWGRGWGAGQTERSCVSQVGGFEQPILLQNGCCLLLMGTQFVGSEGRGGNVGRCSPNLSYCIFSSHSLESCAAQRVMVNGLLQTASCFLTALLKHYYWASHALKKYTPACECSRLNRQNQIVYDNCSCISSICSRPLYCWCLHQPPWLPLFCATDTNLLQCMRKGSKRALLLCCGATENKWAFSFYRFNHFSTSNFFPSFSTVYWTLTAKVLLN